MIEYTPKDVERFWSKVQRGNSDDCWNWQAATNQDGYGNFKVSGKLVGAHRFAWLITFGPTKLNVCHSCDNPLCCNPSHFWEGTQLENIADRHRKGRSSHAMGRAGELAPTRKIDAATSRIIRLEYATGTISQSTLGRKHGLSQQAVSDIVMGKNWKTTL